jgi:hypothetical protein
VATVAHQPDAVEDHRHVRRDKRDVSRAGPIGIDGGHGARADVAARLVVHREQLPVAVCRRQRRVAFVEGNRRRRLGQRRRPRDLLHAPSRAGELFLRERPEIAGDDSMLRDDVVFAKG